MRNWGGRLLMLALGCVMRRWVRMALGVSLGEVRCVEGSGVHWHRGQGGRVVALVDMRCVYLVVASHLLTCS